MGEMKASGHGARSLTRDGIIGTGQGFTGGTVQNGCQAIIVRALLIVGALTLLPQTQMAEAQVKSLSSQESDSSIQATAGEAQAADSQTDPFLQLLDRAIETTSKRTLTANSHSPWQIFHCILAMREKTVLRLGDQKVNAIEWLSTTEPQFDKQPWLLLTPHGAKFHPYTRIYAFEGHPSQFLALLSQSNLPTDYPFHVQGKVVKLSDLIYNTMQEVNTKEEVTWVLWALQHFLKSDAVWTNQANETWSIERLVKMESEAPVVGAPCGGNHRLFALTRARDKYLTSGGQLRGVWFQADQKIRQHIEIARSLQNADGTFSSEFYKGPGQTTDVNKRFNSTGHTMEFLSISLPKERLNEPWVRNAIWTLSRELIIHRDTKIDCGPLFHSLNALILYRDRLRALQPTIEIPNPPESLARKPAAEVAEGLPKLETIPQDLQKPAKPVSEPKKVTRSPEKLAQVPEETKLGSPQPQPVPIPVPEPIVVPEVPAEQPKLELPGTTPQAAAVPRTSTTKSSSPKTVALKPQVNSTKTAIPLIDPSKLPNVGQAAPSGTAPGSTTEPPRTARRESVPALLPDVAAIPLGATPVAPAPIAPTPLALPPKSEPRRQPPIPVTIPDESEPGLKLQPGSLVPEKPAITETPVNPLPVKPEESPATEVKTETAEKPASNEADEEPASALVPANSPVVSEPEAT